MLDVQIAMLLSRERSQNRGKLPGLRGISGTCAPLGTSRIGPGQRDTR